MDFCYDHIRSWIVTGLDLCSSLLSASRQVIESLSLSLAVQLESQDWIQFQWQHLKNITRTLKASAKQVRRT